MPSSSSLGKIPILLTNDDGIHAPGLKQMTRIMQREGEHIFGSPVDIWVVAPAVERSGSSHAISLAEPLRITQPKKQHFSVLGTPVDCVLVALNKLMPRMPKFLFSGINKGRNAADDISLSGTVAAALQGMQSGVTSFAMSQEMDFSQPLGESTWKHAREHAPSLLRFLVDFEKTHHDCPVVMNINFPNSSKTVCGRRIVPHATGYLHTKAHVETREDLRFQKYCWIGYNHSKLAQPPPKGTDIEALTQGYITVTPLTRDWNCLPTLEQLRKSIKSS